jgi:hypothetical protein
MCGGTSLVWLSHRRSVRRVNLRSCANHDHKRFLKTPVTPVNGTIMPTDAPGLAMELDEAKIEEQRPLSWTETRWS